MTGLEQSDPKTLPHATNFPYQPPHPVDVISIDEPYKHLPPEFQDPPAISRSLPSNANPLDIEAHYHHTYVQAYMQHLAKASYHFGKANDLFKAMDELWRHGRVDILEEYQRQFYIHRDIGNQANNQAVNAHQLAAEHFERFNQLRLATAGGSIPVQNISDPYPLPYLNLPVPVYQGPMMGSASTGSQSTFRSVSDTGVNTGNLVISHPNAPGPFLMPFNPEYPHITPSPVYVTPPNGLPVNLAHGAVRTECRSVFIGNLPYDTTWRELKEYLETCIRVDVPRNVDNRAKGYATAIFETPEGAEQACLRFNNSIFKGRPIRVKMDKFCATKLGPDTTIGGPGRGEQSERAAGPVERSAGSAHSPDASVYTAPVVVDGSTSITMKGCKDKSVG
ncbi:hypothetical protein BDZ91DRAFT_473047 [Kalaharituber pfeilii]|nr:hypothetical protein BDZ91DRAFT_473047 [Kalaharituber pfeilii]